MKKSIFILFLMFFMFLVVEDKVYAASDEEILCQYTYSSNFSNYTGYKINIVYDADFENVRYIDSYLYKDKVDDSSPSYSAKLENIVTGKNSDKYGDFFGFNFSGMSIYFDSSSASSLKNNSSCPKYAYYSNDKEYCFDNDGKYCYAELGNEIKKSTKNKSYIFESSNTTSTLSCADHTVSTISNNVTTMCNIKFEMVNDEFLNIYYKEEGQNEYTKLGSGVDNFTCGEKTIYFTNNFSSMPVTSRDDFNQRYLNLTQNSSYCPLIKYYTSSGNKYIILEDSFDAFSNTALQEDSNVDYDKNADWGMNFGEDVNVETCKDLFSPTFLNTINGYMTGIRILVPIALIAFGMLDFSKAVFAGKEDEMKKAQSTFIKRLIIGIVIFFVPTIVNFILNFMNNIYGGGIFGNGTCGIR